MADELKNESVFAEEQRANEVEALTGAYLDAGTETAAEARKQSKREVADAERWIAEKRGLRESQTGFTEEQLRENSAAFEQRFGQTAPVTVKDIERMAGIAEKAEAEKWTLQRVGEAAGKPLFALAERDQNGDIFRQFTGSRAEMEALAQKQGISPRELPAITEAEFLARQMQTATSIQGEEVLLPGVDDASALRDARERYERVVGVTDGLRLVSSNGERSLYAVPGGFEESRDGLRKAISDYEVAERWPVDRIIENLNQRTNAFEQAIEDAQGRIELSLERQIEQGKGLNEDDPILLSVGYAGERGDPLQRAKADRIHRLAIERSSEKIDAAREQRPHIDSGNAIVRNGGLKQKSSEEYFRAELVRELRQFAKQRSHLPYVQPEAAIATNLANQLESGAKTIDLTQRYATTDPQQAEERHLRALQNLAPAINAASRQVERIDDGAAIAQGPKKDEVLAISPNGIKRGLQNATAILQSASRHNNHVVDAPRLSMGGGL